MKLTLIKIMEMILPPFINSLINLLRKSKSKRKISELQNHNIFSTMNRVRSEVGNLKFFTHGEYDKV